MGCSNSKLLADADLQQVPDLAIVLDLSPESRQLLDRSSKVLCELFAVCDELEVCALDPLVPWSGSELPVLG